MRGSPICCLGVEPSNIFSAVGSVSNRLPSKQNIILICLFSEIAWKTSCITSAAANGTLAGVEIPSPHTFDPFAAKFAIAPPSDWDGPFGQGLNMGATVVTVIIGALLGSGLITVLCTM